MRRFDLLRPAQLDLLALAEHAAEYSDEARDRLTDGLMDCFEKLAEFPYLGRAREDLGLGIRSFPLKRLRVTAFYVAREDEPDRVVIARVIRYGQNLSFEDF